MNESIRKGNMSQVSVKRMCVAGVFTAIICMATMLIQIPIPLGYAHLGDSMILLCACMLGGMEGVLAAGVGSAMADLLTGYTQWVLPTLIIKGIMALIVVIIIKKNYNSAKLLSARLVVSAVLALLFMTAGYVVAGAILAGNMYAGLASAPGLLIKSIVNIIVFLVLSAAIRGRVVIN